jgi:hypothetical protein
LFLHGWIFLPVETGFGETLQNPKNKPERSVSSPQEGLPAETLPHCGGTDGVRFFDTNSDA